MMKESKIENQIRVLYLQGMKIQDIAKKFSLKTETVLYYIQQQKKTVSYAASF